MQMYFRHRLSATILWVNHCRFFPKHHVLETTGGSEVGTIPTADFELATIASRYQL